ncbi:hypothetical protein ACRALDRAFT_1059849 [Sodiomyces alcalophilus JCM 7366]|uniref:uncharacterized protein n=1 Tax=Sodiomyces alcalophilus JCM 7366 TaxID=591952 RepID=UPI0039B3B07B
MTKLVVERFDRSQVTRQMLEEASSLFNEHYGLRGHVPDNYNRYCPFKPGPPGNAADLPPCDSSTHHEETGSRVRLSADLLLAKFLPDGSRGCYLRATVEGIFAGYALACRWAYGDRQVCWVTQVVVHRGYRERRLATALLMNVRDEGDDIFGITSPHPAACKALVRACGGRMNFLSLFFFSSTLPPISWYQRKYADN